MARRIRGEWESQAAPSSSPANRPWIVRLSGRCANGAERDGGHVAHVVFADPARLGAPQWGLAACGVMPGRLSAGWSEVDGAEVPSCPRCRRQLELAAK